MFRKIHDELQHKVHRRFYFAGGLLLVILLIMAFFRISAAIALRYETVRQAVPVVAAMVVTKGPAEDVIVLPGNVQAWHEAIIYARTSGYIKKWYVDIGSRVKAGELLAEIETPELDAQLRQAEADLNTAEANNKLAQSTATRWIALLKTDSVSKQETDEKISSAKALQAAVNAARANRDRLRELVSFERVISPFDGVITSRTTDIGALINAGSSSTARPLFRIAQANPLRIYVKVPQSYSSSIKPNLTVKLRFAEHPGKLYTAKLLQTAEAIDPTTRTLLAQFVVDNANDELLPGGYTEVLFNMPLANNIVRLPVNTLLFRAEGLQVATLDKQNKIILKSITISRDFGTEVEVRSGLMPGELVVLNPSDSIFNGQQVRLAPAEKGKQKP
ncbi:MAG: efflux RND transporter periplasmic adaptor subunit [Gammaproteobacteria bacterium]|nr:efflux RND transporter periplasmic adaptor subunit [Gammaproteobacteria bacterium]